MISWYEVGRSVNSCLNEKYLLGACPYYTYELLINFYIIILNVNNKILEWLLERTSSNKYDR